MDSSTSEQTPLSLDKHIQETAAVKMADTETPQGASTGDAGVSSAGYTLKDCETLYGAAMETAHCLIGTRKEGIGHRELPEERRKLQGKMLHNICIKYDIQIPTEFEVIIFGGALIADWQYMSVKESEQEKKPEPAEEQPQEQPKTEATE